MSDDQAYLEPDFDPSTLTVPKLRGILVAHNVTYPASAKKQQLIELFNETVVPQARKIRNASARVKRTSRGIEDVSTGRRGTGAGDEADDIPPTPATGRSTRRSTRARTEEAQEVEPTPRGIRHSTAPPVGFAPRSVSGKHARTVEPVREEEPERKRMSRPSRVSAVIQGESDEEGNFSTENVFQSGSSPPVPRTIDTDRRKTTLGTSHTAVKDLERRARELRRRTDVSTAKQQRDGAVVPTRRTFEVPIARQVKQEEVEPTEEFTPDAQLELTQAQQAGELVPARRRTQRPTSNAKTGIGAVLLVIAATVGGFYRQEKLNVGYCNVGSPSTEVAGVVIPEWADVIRPQCEPCPPHAFCQEQLQTECENGFVLTQHPLSLNGLVPIPPTCEPDSDRARKVNAIKERAVSALREQNAKYECGEATASEIKETALKQTIAARRRKGMTNEQFEDLWDSAIGEIVQAEEVVSGSDGNGHATLRSTSLAAIPLACAVRRSLRETLRQYLWQLIGILLFLSSGAYGRHRITSGNETETKAKQLAGTTLDLLSRQATLHAQEPEHYHDNYISVTQLRDDVLRDEFSTSRRNKLWDKVAKKVEKNANVRSMERITRSGDVGRVWEWVGALGYLESPQSTDNRRKSGRVSFAPEDRLEDSSLNDSVALATTKPNAKKWEESRGPYF